MVVSLLHAISAYSSTIHPAGACGNDIKEILGTAGKIVAEQDGDEHKHSGIRRLMALVPEYSGKVEAMLAMSMIDEPVVNPVFSRTDAVGSVMRKKLKPVSDPILGLIDILTT